MNEWAGKSGSSQATLASARRASVAELTFIHSAPVGRYSAPPTEPQRNGEWRAQSRFGE